MSIWRLSKHVTGFDLTKIKDPTIYLSGYARAMRSLKAAMGHRETLPEAPVLPRRQVRVPTMVICAHERSYHATKGFRWRRV